MTGATGFVGRHVLSELLAQGFYVYCIISGKRLIDELQHPKVQYCEIDFLDASFETKITDLFSKQPADFIIHSAWYTEHKNYVSATVNIKWAESSKILIDAFYAHGGKRFIGLGTCIEYDFNYVNGQPISLNTPIKGSTLYAKCKIEVFNHLKNLQEKAGIDYVWARLFFIYGPYDKKGRLIPYIYEQIMLNKQAIPRFGASQRDYIFVKDLARQLVAIVRHTYQGAINMGTEHPFKIQDIFDSIGRIMHKKHLVIKNDVLSNNTEYEPYSIVADLTEWHKMNQDFEFTPLTEGLQQTVSWMRENYAL